MPLKKLPMPSLQNQYSYEIPTEKKRGLVEILFHNYGKF
jgi:hypothetical protein